MAIVAFDLVTFRARYPEFNAVSDASLTAYFSEATLYCNNSDASLISDVSVRGMILNMLVAHIAALSSTDIAATMVGRVSSAGEGSVNVSTAYVTPSAGRAWLDQTKYGASAWQAMSPYRRAYNVAPSTQIVTVIPQG